MVNKIGLVNGLAELWKVIGSKQRVGICITITLTIISSLSEIISIGSLIPFLAVVSDPNLINNNSYYKIIKTYINIDEGEIFFYSLILFIFLSTISALIKLIQVWYINKTSYLVGAEISLKVYSKSLYLPYYAHINKNSSVIISNIFYKTNSIPSNLVQPTISLINSVFISLSILLLLLFINASVTLIILISFSFIYLSIGLFTNERLKRDSIDGTRYAAESLKLVQESLGGIRDIILDNSQKYFINNFNDVDYKSKYIQAKAVCLNITPKYVVESLGIIIIALTTYFLSIRASSPASVIPVLGVFALSAQRLLPNVQQIYSAWSTLTSSYGQLIDISNFLKENLYEKNAIFNTYQLPFSKSIVLEDVCYSYPSSINNSLKNVNYKFIKGSSYGIVGKSGGGKSTLLDLLMGLLIPTSGNIFIDGIKITEQNLTSWQSNIAHVPQFIFLADLSIYENIAFGVDRKSIDEDKCFEIINKVALTSLVESLPEGLNTRIGERGIRLSGGQRQRIGLARALYKGAKVIFLDEATSALDVDTEGEIMKTIYSLGNDITLIMVAHRRSTLDSCQYILELSEGEIVSR